MSEIGINSNISNTSKHVGDYLHGMIRDGHCFSGHYTMAEYMACLNKGLKVDWTLDTGLDSTASVSWNVSKPSCTQVVRYNN